MWSTFHWLKSLVWRFGDRDSGRNVHGPVVTGLSLVLVLGGVSYAISRPLRGRHVARLMLAAVKMPFRLYDRLHLRRWLSPATEQPTGAP
jgi:hypothetical protein